MEHEQFVRLTAEIAAASARQLLELAQRIGGIVSEQIVEMALAGRTRRAIQDRNCPHCGIDHVVLHGKDQNRRQRFKCCGCQRTYNIMTGTPMARARKPEKWGQYLGCMTGHMSVRKIAQTGIGVHQVTIWRWRHRFLEAAANDNAAVLSGIIEVDNTLFSRSFKGSRGWKRGTPPAKRAARPCARGVTKRGLSHDHVPVLSALDSSGAVLDAILVSLSEIETALDGLIVAGSVLCSDGSTAFVNVAEKANAEHYTVSGPRSTQHVGKTNPDSRSDRKPRCLGLGRVARHHQRLKDLIDRRCMGVATKYLGNYLGWHRAMIRPDFEGRVLLYLALL